MGEAADLVFRSKTNSTDYHDEMNHEHYIEWLTEQLLTSLHDNSVIVLSSATYHNKLKHKPPTTADKKETIRNWLRQHGIDFQDYELK